MIDVWPISIWAFTWVIVGLVLLYVDYKNWQDKVLSYSKPREEKT